MTALNWLFARRNSLFVFIAPLLAAPAAVAAPKPGAAGLAVEKLAVSSRVIRSFSKSGSRSRRYGALTFRGGLVLSSPNPAFGGFSGLEISPDGKTIFAVSDAGAWLKARLAYRKGRPVALTGAVLGPIKALKNRRLIRGRDRDAEAIRLISGTFEKGIALVGFERNQRIGFFPIEAGKLQPPRRYLRPPIRLRGNKGIEAAGMLNGGRFKGGIVAFAERTLDANGHHRGWMWHAARKKGKPPRTKLHPLALTNIGGFDITDIAGAKDGSLYVLERRFRWSEGVKMRVRRIPAGQFRPGTVLSGEVLITANLAQEIDNMEGLALHHDKSGRLILTMISDDNFNAFLQRTLLLQFEVTG